MMLWGYVRRGWAERAWKGWYDWAIRSRLAPIKRAAPSQDILERGRCSCNAFESIPQYTHRCPSSISEDSGTGAFTFNNAPAQRR
jgi:hypothetical protein